MHGVLFHFSEDPTIKVFAPHVARSAKVKGARVWAIDAAHSPSYWFPRECPRVCVWPSVERPVTAANGRLLLGAARLHIMESAWLARMRACALYRYSFDPAPFAPEPDSGGAWCARETVRPLSVAPVGDLLDQHAEAGIDLRIASSLWPAIEAAIASGLEFSIIRSANALPRVESA